MRAFPGSPSTTTAITPLHFTVNTQAIDPQLSPPAPVDKYTMGFWDTIADLAESVAPWNVAEAEAPAAEDSKVRQ